MWMTVGAVLVALGVVAFVLQPVVAGRRAPLQRDDEEPTEAEARKRVALLALRDVEYDYATGKLDDTDYEQLRGELAAEALEALRAEEAEAEDGERLGDVEPGGYPAGRSLDELEQEIAAYRAALRRGAPCPTCGHLNEAESRFCAQCGSPLGEEAPAPAGAAARGSGDPSVEGGAEREP